MPFLTAEWRHLAMLNYVVDPAILCGRVPHGTELDLRESRCFVSVVGFRFRNTRVVGVPIPFHRNFEEVNLRFYVRCSMGKEVRRGVVFPSASIPAGESETGARRDREAAPARWWGVLGFAIHHTG